MANDIPDIDTDDLILTIEHPMGRIETTFTQWIERGPGPRELVKPVAVRSRTTGQNLPLTVIPMRYRNDDESRRLIAEGEIDSPW